MDKNTLLDIDKKYLWHPYTDINYIKKENFPIIGRAKGSYLYDVDGNKYIDAISSWWCVNFGHGHPDLVDAAKKQLDILQHSILGGISHPTVIFLSEKIAKITPKGLNHTFFAGDGSSATEGAIKMAIQYWYNIGKFKKNKLVGLNGGYHGDTLGAISLGYVEKFHKCFKDILPLSYRVKSPHCSKCNKIAECNLICLEEMEELFDKKHEEIAGIMIEPLCQGANGINIYPEKYLIKLRKLCDQYEVLLIADEIAVGFGRTGAMFACSRAGIIPDMMLIGKGLTGGYLPMSAVVVSDKVYDSFISDSLVDRCFYHGHTFTGNPITSALALTALSLYEKLDFKDIDNKASLIKAEFIKIEALFNSSRSNSLGMIGAIYISTEEGGSVLASKICATALNLGLFIRPLGNVVYIWPPLNISIQELKKIFDLLREAIAL